MVFLFYFFSCKFLVLQSSIISLQMSAKKIKQNSLPIGVQLFSDMMLMKLKPKNTEGMSLIKQDSAFRQKMKQKHKFSDGQLNEKINEKLNHIQYVQAASNDSFIIGNHSQIDMIGLNGTTKKFVDTQYYWSLNIKKPIMDLKVNIKKKIFIILTYKTLHLYSYNELMVDRNQPIYVSAIQLPFQVKFLQFATQDLIAIFYEQLFQVYFVNDNNIANKILSKRYNVEQNFKLLAVPQSIDSTIKIFFEEQHEELRTFGLWCLEIYIENEAFIVNTIYKIYEIMNSLKSILILENYSKEIVFLNFGKELLVAKKGYIIDSVSINFQIEHSHLEYLPKQQILVHVEKNYMDLYSFKINLNAMPTKIQLSSIDSIAINNNRKNSKFIYLHPMHENNFVVFYEDYYNTKTTKGEIFYSFLLSYTVPLAVKIKSILSIKKLQNISPEDLQARCDILRKIGLSDQEIYLEIWRSSTRSTLVQFNILLATGDYKTIKSQIEAKLRKKSMPYKQICKIQESCQKIIRQKMMKSQFNEEMLKDYISCNLFLRKLRLFKELFITNLSGKNLQNVNSFQITIEDYNNLKNAELKNLVLEQLSNYLYKNSKNIDLIRVTLFHFRFIYRFIYSELIEQIMKMAKHDFIKILQAIPELLPIDFGYLESISEEKRYLHEGVWFQISQTQWQNNLYLEKLAHAFNYDDKENLMTFANDTWFHRNWLTIHDLIPSNIKDIQKKNNSMNSVKIFYLCIEKLFQNIKDEKVIKSTLSFLERKYTQYPQHLRDKVYLYSKLYKYYKERRISLNQPFDSMSQFIQQRDQHLFKFFFQYEKQEKNFILKRIKPLYESSVKDGSNVFNQSLLNYFKSPISQISHLKYILNRINNEKEEYHVQNEKMYEILIQAFQLKVKIGRGKEEPIKQILIYIESIPFSADNHFIIEQIRTIQRISEQTQTLKQIRIDMTISQIRQHFHEVIEKIVIYHINKLDILHAQSKITILSKARKILDQINTVKQNLYGKENNELAFFILLTKLLQNQNKIDVVITILNDEYYNSIYEIDNTFVENLVIYMYRWKFSQELSYQKNQGYLTQLVEVLPEQNGFRKFITYQLQLALILSTPSKHVLFPIAEEFIYPKISQIEEIIKQIDPQDLIKINIQVILELLIKLQGLNESSESRGSKLLSIISKSSNNEKIEHSLVYEMFMKYYLKAFKVRQSLELVNKIIEKGKNNPIIEILAIIKCIISELNQESKKLLCKIAAVSYYKASILVAIVQSITLHKLTGIQCINILSGKYRQLKQTGSIYSERNPIFNTYFDNIKQQKNKKILIKHSFQKIVKSNKKFANNYGLTLIYLVMCFQPFKLACLLDYFDLDELIHFKSFIGNMIVQDIFYENNVLEISKRSLAAMLKKMIRHINLHHIVEKERFYNLEQDYIIDHFNNLEEDPKKLSKIIKIFERKIKKLQDLKFPARLKKKYSSPEKEISILVTLKNIKININDDNDQIFQEQMDSSIDQDNTIEQDKQEDRIVSTKKKEQFQPLVKRGRLLKRLKTKRSLNNNNNNIKIKKYLSQDQNGNNQSKSDQFVREDEKFLDDFSTPEKNPKNLHVTINNNKQDNVQRLSFQSLQVQPSSAQIKIRQLKTLSESEKSPVRQKPKIIDLQMVCDENAEFCIESIMQIVKNIYKTYTDKLQDEPYSIRYLAYQKNRLKDKYPEFLKDVIFYAYENPHRGLLSNSLKLIIQIGKKYKQLLLNIQNLIIYQRIANFQERFSLNISLSYFLKFEAIYMKNTTSRQLYEQIKADVLFYCNDENLVKMTKLIAIGFKINTLQNEIFFTYLKKILVKIHLSIKEEEEQTLYKRVKNIIHQTRTEIIVDKAKSISSECQNLQIRRKITGIIGEELRSRGNGMDMRME